MDQVEIADRIAENRLFEHIATADIEDQALAQVSLQAIHAASRTSGSGNRRVEICHDSACRTFNTYRISGGDDDLFVLCHRRFGLIAFSRSDPTGMGVADARLCYAESEAGAIAQFDGLIVLPLTFLTTPVTSTILSDLCEQEQGDAAYWQPARLADVVFNHWD